VKSSGIVDDGPTPETTTADHSELAELQRQSFARAGRAVRSSLPEERHLTGHQLSQFLDRHRFACAATTRPNGKPHAAMTSYVRSGTVFRLPTMVGTVRARNIQAQPWMSIIVTEGEDEHHIAVTAEGPAEVVALDDIPVELHTPSWATCWIKMTPARLFSYAGTSAPI